MSTAYKGRVLIVDDLPDWRATLSGLLSDEGYYVSSASSKVEALQMLDAERFHVAVLDVRLDDADEDNREGLVLMREIKQKDPTVVIIILTGYADVQMVQEALQPDSQGHSPAFGFLQKTQSDASQLPGSVKRGFEHAVRIDTALEIQDPGQSLSLLHQRIRFVQAPQPSQEQLMEDADELLRKLFLGCEQVQLWPMQRGSYSGVAIFQVIPWYRDRGRGEVLVAKIGEHFLVEDEYTKYKTMVQGLVGGHRLPRTLEFARARSLSGILYTFAGLGTARDFATFYLSSDTSQVLSALENLFVKTCFPWRRSSGLVCEGSDLGEVYSNLLRLDQERLRTCLDQTMGKPYPFRGDKTGKWIWLGDKIRLVNPVVFVLSADLKTDFYASTIHGNLHGYNVLVDEHNEAWLIDFANTCKGPLLQDYASFETFLRISLVECSDWNLLYGWEQALFRTSDLCAPRFPLYMRGAPEIQKSNEAVLAVRRMALQESPGETERTYLIGLLFNTLKTLTIMSTTPTQRDHALISAALIAERLQDEDRGEITDA